LNPSCQSKKDYVKKRSDRALNFK